MFASLELNAGPELVVRAQPRGLIAIEHGLGGDAIELQPAHLPDVAARNPGDEIAIDSAWSDRRCSGRPSRRRGTARPGDPTRSGPAARRSRWRTSSSAPTHAGEASPRTVWRASADPGSPRTPRESSASSAAPASAATSACRRPCPVRTFSGTPGPRPAGCRSRGGTGTRRRTRVDRGEPDRRDRSRSHGIVRARSRSRAAFRS